MNPLRWTFPVTMALIACALAGCSSETPGPAPTPVAGRSELLDQPGDGSGVLDLLSGRLVETADSVIAEIEVATLDLANLGASLLAAGYSNGYVEICWGAPDADDAEEDCAEVFLDSRGSLPATAYLESGRGPDRGCNDWHWCAWNAPLETVEGSPGLFRVHVPRALLYNATAGAILDDPILKSGGQPIGATGGERMVGRRAFAGACAVVTCVTRTVNPYMPVEEVDYSQPGADLVLGLEASPTAVPAASGATTILVDAADDISTGVQGERPDLDILSVDLVESTSHVTYEVQVASLDVLASHSFDMEVGIGPIVYEAWYTAAAGQVVEPLGGYCADTDCDVWQEFIPEVTIEPGSPGTIRVALAWADLAPVPRGAMLTLAEAEMGDAGVYQSQAPGGVVSGWAFVGGAEWDWVYHAEPYWFARGATS